MPTGYISPAGSTVNFNFAGSYIAPVGDNTIINFLNTNAYVLTVDVGSYAIAGTTASLKVGRALRAYENLITNGGFSVDTTGWTVDGADTTFTSVSQQGELTLGLMASGGFAWQAVSVVSGRYYNLSVFVDGDEGSTNAGVRVGTTLGGNQLGFAESVELGETKVISFVGPSGGVVYVQLYTSTSSDCTAHFDDIVLEDSGSYLLTGAPVGLLHDFLLSVTVGAYLVSGSGISLKIGRRLSTAGGTYVLSGSNVGLLQGHLLAATPGTYTLTGSAVAVRYGHAILVTPGLYTLTGTAVALLWKHILRILSGVYSQVRADISLRFGHRVKVTPGTYELNGNPPIFTYHEVNKIAADAGVYALTGSDATFVYNHRLTITPGAYLTQGHAPQLLMHRLFREGSGSYAIDGTPVTLSEGGQTLGIDRGVYRLAGGNAAMVVTRQMSPASGAYSVAGTAAQQLAARRLAIGDGVYSTTGALPQMEASRLIQPVSGAYVLTGHDPALSREYDIRPTEGAYSLDWTGASLAAARRMTVGARAFQIVMAQAQVNYQRTPPGLRCVAVDPAPTRYLAVDPLPRNTPVDPMNRLIDIDPADERYAGVEPLERET